MRERDPKDEKYLTPERKMDALFDATYGDLSPDWPEPRAGKEAIKAPAFEVGKLYWNLDGNAAVFLGTDGRRLRFYDAFRHRLIEGQSNQIGYRASESGEDEGGQYWRAAVEAGVISAGDGEYTPYRDPTSAALVAQAPELLRLAKLAP